MAYLIQGETGDWEDAACVEKVTGRRTVLRCPPRTARRVRFDFGTCADQVGSRVCEIGVLAAE